MHCLWLFLKTVLCALLAESLARKKPDAYESKRRQKSQSKNENTNIEFNAAFKLPKQFCPCASVKPEVHADWEESDKRVKRSPAGDDRIVGGYDTEFKKPWVARIWINPQDQLCGGTLINKRYILTAGHCVCKKSAKLICNEKGEPQYDVKTWISVYLGVNNKKIDYLNKELKGQELYEYGVEWGVAHPLFIEKKEITQDIGLYRLDRDARIEENRLQPICLPLTHDKSDVVTRGSQELAVYTSGWGRLFSACVTNEFGPVKNLKCMFPFTYRRKTQFGCVNSRTPSAKDKDCKKLWRHDKDKYPKKAGDVISLFVEEKNITKTCYSMSPEGGWCQGVETDNDFTDNWGWCKDHCKYKEGSIEHAENILASRLQETKLSVLPMGVCKKLVTKGGYQFWGKYDMCAGRKKNFKTIQSFIQTVDGKYKSGKNITNYFGLNDDGKYPYDYYIGGTDSCSGDSGGSLYYWKDGVPTLLGVVSRGYGSDKKNGCAELNYPGIYTRVTRYLEWIHHHVKEGNC